MKFSSLSTALVLLASGAAVSATQTVTVTTYAPIPTTAASQCNTGGLWCCNNVQTASGGLVSVLLGLLGVVVDPITALVGSSCSPINVLGVGPGGMCTAQPVCCQDNDFSGLVVIGCTPVTLGV